MRNFLLLFFSHRTLALLRWDLHFMAIRLKNLLFFKTPKLRKRIKNHDGPLYLNLGSGPRGLDTINWINVDGFKDTNVHYLCDFNRPFPFNPETFDGIFCEHVLEHFTYHDGRKLMIECKRILKTNGVIRIIVPDGSKFLTAYFEEPGKIVEYKQVPSGFPMEAVNSWFYQRYEHQCIYDGDYLIDSLLKAGFREAQLSSFEHSTLGEREIVLDDAKYNWESLYVEARK